DVVLLDIDLPGLSGIAALPAIHAIAPIAPIAPTARVIMVSGLNDDPPPRPPPPRPRHLRLLRQTRRPQSHHRNCRPRPLVLEPRVSRGALRYAWCARGAPKGPPCQMTLSAG